MAAGIQVRKDLLIDTSELQLVKQIGEGSYGQVWKGVMGTIDVAVKKLILARASPPILRSIEKEIDTLATLHHAHVLQIYGVCLFNNSSEFWIVMEYADGGSLYSILSDESLEIPWDIRWKWIQEVAASVAFLHKRGVVHRDIKSPNFLIVKDSIKICDFGMATTASVSSSATLSSAIKSVGSIGTVRWLAPESTARVPVFDTKTDVYGMGMVIWEVVSREIPFKDIHQDAQVLCLVKYENERPAIPSDCPEGIAEVIRKCWHQDPNVRPTAAEAVLEINKVITPLLAMKSEEFVQEIPPESTTTHTSAVPLSAPTPIDSATTSSNATKDLVVQKLSKVDKVTTFVGSVEGIRDAKGTDAKFKSPFGACFNPHDNCLYVCDNGNGAIRKVTLDGEVITFVFDIDDPFGIVMSYKEQCFYVPNYKRHTILKISMSGSISVFAGNTADSDASIEPGSKVGRKGYSDGVGTAASFDLPYDLAIDQKSGTLYVCDMGNRLIRKITSQGVVTTLTSFADAAGRETLYEPRGICFDDQDQSIVVADYRNNQLRRITQNGDVSVLCNVKSPSKIAIANDHSFIVSSGMENQVFRVYPEGKGYKVEVLAGSGKKGKQDGRAEESTFDTPRGLTIHPPTGTCFVADSWNHVLRKISFESSDQRSFEDDFVLV